MSRGTPAIAAASHVDESLHLSFQDRWAPTLAAVFTAIHFVAGGLVLSWYYFVVPQLKTEVEEFGSLIGHDAEMLIRQSDFVINYWYLMLIVAPLALKSDFLVMRWGMKQSGLKWGLFAGACIVSILLVTVISGQLVTHQARILVSATKS